MAQIPQKSETNFFVNVCHLARCTRRQTVERIIDAAIIEPIMVSRLSATAQLTADPQIGTDRICNEAYRTAASVLASVAKAKAGLL
jgi:hypothetical protein